LLRGTNQEIITQIRKDIQGMKEKTEKVVLLWTANTEMFYLPEIATVEDLRAAIS